MSVFFVIHMDGFQVQALYIRGSLECVSLLSKCFYFLLGNQKLNEIKIRNETHNHQNVNKTKKYPKIYIYVDRLPQSDTQECKMDTKPQQ